MYCLLYSVSVCCSVNLRCTVHCNILTVFTVLFAIRYTVSCSARYSPSILFIIPPVFLSIRKPFFSVIELRPEFKFLLQAETEIRVFQYKNSLLLNYKAIVSYFTIAIVESKKLLLSVKERKGACNVQVN